MVQVLPAAPTFGSEFGKGLGTGIAQSLPDQLNQFFTEKRKKRELQDFLSSEAGQSFSDEQRALIEGAHKGLIPQSALSQVLSSTGKEEFSEENYDIIKNAFGEQFADLWKAAPTGGQTALLSTALDARMRGLNIKDLLAEIGGPEGAPRTIEGAPPPPALAAPIDEGVPAAIEGEGREVRMPAPDKGLLPKERIVREESRYKTNLPLYQATSKKLEGNETEGLAIQRLETLNESGNLPSGLQRWNIRITGDDQGELIFPWLATDDTQAFIKTVNDFTTKAKDSFGSRVTNFELRRFMKRLPGLLNSEEGRRLILRQMSVINELNTLHNQGIVDEIERAGGVRKIDYDTAERLSKRRNSKRVAELKKEFIKLEGGVAKATTKPKALRRVEKGTALTEDEALQILDKVGGDKTKARKLAGQLGYKI